MAKMTTIKPKLMIDKELLADQYRTLEVIRQYHEQRGHTRKSDHIEGVLNLIDEIFIELENDN